MTGIGFLLSYNRLGGSFDDVSGNIGQAEVPPLDLPPACVIDAHQIEQGRVQIVDVDLIRHDPVTELIGLADRNTALDPCARRPGDSECVGMVIALGNCPGSG